MDTDRCYVPAMARALQEENMINCKVSLTIDHRWNMLGFLYMDTDRFSVLGAKLFVVDSCIYRTELP